MCGQFFFEIVLVRLKGLKWQFLVLLYGMICMQRFYFGKLLLEIDWNRLWWQWFVLVFVSFLVLFGFIVLMFWCEMKWYFIQNILLVVLIYEQVCELYLFMCCQLWGRLCLFMRQVIWWVFLGERVQKFYCMLVLCRLELLRCFWEWMKLGNFMVLWRKNVGVLLLMMLRLFLVVQKCSEKLCMLCQVLGDFCLLVIEEKCRSVLFVVLGWNIVVWVQVDMFFVMMNLLNVLLFLVCGLCFGMCLWLKVVIFLIRWWLCRIVGLLVFIVSECVLLVIGVLVCVVVVGFVMVFFFFVQV